VASILNVVRILASGILLPCWVTAAGAQTLTIDGNLAVQGSLILPASVAQPSGACKAGEVRSVEDRRGHRALAVCQTGNTWEESSDLSTQVVELKAQVAELRRLVCGRGSRAPTCAGVGPK
jgi:hypothetical protein